MYRKHDSDCGRFAGKHFLFKNFTGVTRFPHRFSIRCNFGKLLKESVEMMRQNFSRPSIDVSFISAAAVFGVNLTGILLSGANDDGAEGLRQIKEHGGYTIIQDPEEAAVGHMPKKARLKSKIDEVLNTEGITHYLLSRISSAGE